TRQCAFEGPVEQRSLQITAHKAVGDGDVLSRTSVPQSERTLRADSIVVRRIHAAIRYAHISSAIEVDAVAIGINHEIVDGEVIDASGKNAEVAAMQNRKISQNDIPAVLQRNRLITHAGIFCLRSLPCTAAQPFSPNESGTQDRKVLNSLP